MINNNSLNTLKLLEKDFNIIKFFKFKKTTAWINVKNYLYTKSLNSVVSLTTDNKKSFLTINGFKLVILSILYYFKALLKRDSKVLYIGAGSGLFEYDDNTLDSYMPKELKNIKLIYMLSAEYPDKLINHKEYIKKHNIVIFSFLIAPFKVIASKIIYRFINIKLANNFFDILKKSNNPITKKEINYIYTKFIVSYYLYKIFLMFFKIEKAYIVSAYSNTEFISILKERGIEVIELQHGLIGSTHRGYNYAVSDELLPTPDKVYVYDGFWKQELLNAGFYNEKQIIVSGRLKYELVKKDIVIYKNRYIVFTGQGGFYNEIKELFKSSQEFLEKNHLKFIYIPHPNESENDILSLENTLATKQITIIKHKDFTTEQYIYNSLAHISVYSSCHFDAIYYKNKTYVFDIMDDNPMNYYLNSFRHSFISIKTINDLKGAL